MLGRLDDTDALKQGYSRLPNYFSGPVSEVPLTYRGELIDGNSYSTSGLKGITLNSVKGTKYSINPITPPQPPA